MVSRDSCSMTIRHCNKQKLLHQGLSTITSHSIAIAYRVTFLHWTFYCFLLSFLIMLISWLVTLTARQKADCAILFLYYLHGKNIYKFTVGYFFDKVNVSLF